MSGSTALACLQVGMTVSLPAIRLAWAQKTAAVNSARLRDGGLIVGPKATTTFTRGWHER